MNKCDSNVISLAKENVDNLYPLWWKMMSLATCNNDGASAVKKNYKEKWQHALDNIFSRRKCRSISIPEGDTYASYRDTRDWVTWL